MSNDIISSSYNVGIGTKNLILNTRSKVYIKVADKYYELDFKNNSSSSSSNDSDITAEKDFIIVKSSSDIDTLEYPGDNKLIITLDGNIYTTSDSKISKWTSSDTSSLDLSDLTINGTLNIEVEDGVPPFSISSKQLVENLNAQYLNGNDSSQFAVKKSNETVTGEWSFGNVVINGVISNGAYPSLTIDLIKNEISVDTLNVKTINCESLKKYNYLIHGLGGITILNKEVDADTFVKTSKTAITDINFLVSKANYDLIEYAYTTGYLESNSSSLTLNFWIGLFLTSSVVNGISYLTAKDYTDATIISTINASLTSVGLNDITYYKYLLDSIILASDIEGYLGDYYLLTFNDINEITHAILPRNIIVSDDYSFIGIVIMSSINRIFVKCKEDTMIFPINKHFVSVGHSGDGTIMFNTKDNVKPYIDILSTFTPSIQKYPSKLTNNDNVIGRMGLLNGLAKDFDDYTFSGMGVYLKGPNVFLKNPNIYTPTTKILSDGSVSVIGENENTNINFTNPNITTSTTIISSNGNFSVTGLENNININFVNPNITTSTTSILSSGVVSITGTIGNTNINLTNPNITTDTILIKSDGTFTVTGKSGVDTVFTGVDIKTSDFENSTVIIKRDGTCTISQLVGESFISITNPNISNSILTVDSNGIFTLNGASGNTKINITNPNISSTNFSLTSAGVVSISNGTFNSPVIISDNFGSAADKSGHIGSGFTWNSSGVITYTALNNLSTTVSNINLAIDVTSNGTFPDGSIAKKVQDISTTITGIQSSISTITGQYSTMSTDIADLKQRVTALENA